MTAPEDAAEPAEPAVGESIPPAMAEVRDLTDQEYDETYASGDGGHQLPPEVQAELSGHDDPEAVPPT